MIMRLIASAAIWVATTSLAFNARDQQRPPAPAPAPATQPTATQPATSKPTATRPAPTSQTTRRSEQMEIIQNLLRAERTKLILPQGAESVGQTDVMNAGADRAPILVDGTILVDRPGRLIVEQGKPTFVFHAESEGAKLTSMEILPNRLLEAMQREAQTAAPDFVISAEVTRYANHNYLLLRKVVRRVGHGNLAP